ncbi:MAG TPA: hypothetical protein VFM65_10945 [Flavobacteriaceae bacterium]|nr:hypothetical protein [Flavobacteriaceae bacterium]
MKVRFLSIIVILSLYSCQNDSKIIVSTEEDLQKLSTVHSEIFNLGKKKDSIILGSNGTKIFYSREALEIDDNQPVTLELKEIYNVKKLIFNNINISKNENNLKKSLGVIFFEFRTNDQKVRLKKTEQLKVDFPFNIEENLIVLKGEISSPDEISWTKKKVDIPVIILDTNFLKKYRVSSFLEKKIPLDSLDYYKNLRLELFKKGLHISDSLNIYSVMYLPFTGWTSIYKNIQSSSKTSFRLELNNTEIEIFTIYIIYHDLNSYFSMSRSSKNLNFENIPVTKETSLIILGRNRRLYYDKLKLGNKSRFKIKLKEIDLKKLDAIFEDIETRK